MNEHGTAVGTLRQGFLRLQPLSVAGRVAQSHPAQEVARCQVSAPVAVRGDPASPVDPAAHSPLVASPESVTSVRAPVSGQIRGMGSRASGATGSA